MKKLVFGLVGAVGALAVLLSTPREAGSRMRGRVAGVRERRMEGMMERMMERMPESSPPKRMMADLEAIRADTARILELLEKGNGVGAEDNP
jgi:hypothetical protein